MHSMRVRRLFGLCLVLVGLGAAPLTSFVSGEIPESTKNALRANAPEQLEIKVLAVKRTAGLGRFNLKFVVSAEINEARKSSTGLKKGDRITIEYTSPNPEVGKIPPGSYPRPLAEGETCMAYLKSEAKGESGERVYTPAAASGSF